MIKTDTVETTTLHELMVWYRGNQAKAARSINMNRGTLRNHLTTGKAKSILLEVHRDGTGEIYDFTLINRR